MEDPETKPDGDRILPVFAHREEFIQLCKSKEHAVILVVGETGSGKTTQLAQFLLDDIRPRRISVTQPRRVAATTLARRVSKERSSKLGEQVGYRVRFDDKTSSNTRLIYCTDGLLLREAISDPALRSYDFIVLDEAHERSLNTDILFGVVKRALKLRNENNIRNGGFSLRVIIMSATLDTQLFQDFFATPLMMTVKGRQHPVDTWYLPKNEDDRVELSAKVALQIHKDEPLPGDILVFLPGVDEIDACVRALKENGQKLGIIACPLHASLSSNAQLQAFERAPVGFRKVVVATNVAETSVTVDGVKFVIDSGVLKVKQRDKKTGLRRLMVTTCAKSQAIQRSGRAGREYPGKCYRLYTESKFESMNNSALPEILRIELSEVVLMLLALGVDNIQNFDFLQSPNRRGLEEALTDLHALEAIGVDSESKSMVLTERGKKMSKLPVDPFQANLILKGIEMQCAYDMAGIVAMGGGSELPFHGTSKEALQAKRKWLNKVGDHLTTLSVLNAFTEESQLRVAQLKEFTRAHYMRQEVLMQGKLARDQLIDICKSFVEHPELKRQLDLSSDYETVTMCLVCGMGSTRLAKRVSGTSEYETLFKGKNRAFLHPSTTLVMLNLKPEYVVFDELLVTSRPYLRGVTTVEHPEWLVRDQPQLFSQTIDNMAWKEAQQQVRTDLKRQRSSAIN